MSPLDI